MQDTVLRKRVCIGITYSFVGIARPTTDASNRLGFVDKIVTFVTVREL